MRHFPLTLFVPFLAAASSFAATDKVDFNYDIRPIISGKCFHCHGPDEKSREAKLRLDVREEAIKERDGIRAIVPGDPEASDAMIRVISEDKDDVMPPPKEGHAITPEESALLRKWIEQGAEYKPHWAFEKPVQAAVPGIADCPLPIADWKNGEAGFGDWSRNPIDGFILQKLAARGLMPSPEADPYSLARRLFLDLTGLPPTPEETDAFVREWNVAPSIDDRQSAIGNLTDRLLASPAYGERWARMWLDLARYADSTGYGSDAFRLNIWPYRDWVIGAFNRNLPFDHFTIEQLAGDLLPAATPDQITATAFHRNTMTNTEGGTIDEEWRVAAVKDRIATTGQVWMGLTVGCAQCHTHKFDPISHREYYQLFAIFNQTADSDRGDEAPTLPLPTDEERARQAGLRVEIEAIEKQLASSSAEIEAEQHEWEADMAREGGLQARASAVAKSQADATQEMPDGIRTTLAVEPSERTPEQRAELLAYFRPLSVRFRALDRDLREKKAELAKIKPVEVPIMRELPAAEQRENFIMVKGNYLARGDRVEPGFLATFAAAAPHDTPIDRLAAARWLLSPENPLTARVAVNRFWAQIFGTGLVETEEDFGTQGTLPSHPELLDWLAVAFRDGSQRSTLNSQPSLGWDVKALLKLIVTSATYRQASNVNADALQRDPRNRLLSHYPRRRLDAEAVRDQALAVSGLLSRKLGGPSVYPPQPPGLWNVAFNNKQNSYPTSTGEDRYRRGLYTFWRRTMPHPGMTTFDAPSRESCTIRRIPTNTPLQAFVTLNDPVFVEAAQALARRIVAEGGTEPATRLAFGLRLVLARPAAPAQIGALQHLLDSELAHFRAAPADALKLATDPLGPLPPGADAAELAAYTVIANVLLNLDAALTRG